MAILNHRLGRRLVRPLALALACAVVAGCAIWNVFGGGSKPLAFSHARHAQEGIECADCHSLDAADHPGMPKLAACKLCHEAIDKEKPKERAIVNLFDGDEFRAAMVTKLSGEIVFSHGKHVDSKIECASCHAGIAGNERIDDSVALRMEDCRSCHTQKNLVAECSSCHRTVRSDVAPATHAFAWRRLHGRTVRAESMATADNCKLCHQQSTCTSCHQSEPPDNHDNYFRLRAHGLFARMDRQNCQACHRDDSCESCHQSTQPVSHVGSFGGTQSTHCLSCHFPLQDNDCATCHHSNPGHQTAAPKPPGHTAGMNCRQCHGHGQPLPHVDKGDDCNSCHR
jgi:hypothetical protein